MGDGLIERLNAEECIGVGASGEPLMCLTNPDGPEAASRIAELEARIETARMDRVRAREREAELEAKLATAVGALEATKDRVNTYPIDDQEHCMCGSTVAGHDIGSGHSPVSQGDYSVKMIVEAIEEALRSIQERT